MYFLHIWNFFQHCPTHHKATSHFIKACFRFVQTTVFLLPFSLLHNNLSRQTFTSVFNAYKLYFILVHNVYIVHENVELVPVLSSVLCYLLRFLENRAQSQYQQGNLFPVKTATKQSWWLSGTSLQYVRKLSCFSFFYQSHPNCLTKKCLKFFMTNRFPTESNFQGDLSKEFFPPISLFQL